MSCKDEKVIKQIQSDIKQNLQVRDIKQGQFDIINTVAILKDVEHIDKQILLLTDKKI